MPKGVKRDNKISRFVIDFGSEGERVDSTVMPSLIYIIIHSENEHEFKYNQSGARLTLVGVLGIDRTTVQVVGTHSFIIAIVVPAKIEINNFPSNASDIPGACNKAAAICGLQLCVVQNRTDQGILNKFNPIRNRNETTPE